MRYCFALWLFGLLLGGTGATAHAQVYATRAVKDGKWAILNGDGIRVTGFDFDYVSDFQGGLAVFEQNGQEGLVHYSGRIVLPAQWEVVEFIFTETDGEDLGGSLVTEAVRIMNSDKWGLASTRSGRVLLEPTHDYVNFYSEGLVFANTGGRWVSRNTGDTFEGGKWALMDTTGRRLTEAVFTRVRPFSNGLAEVVQADKWGLLDRTAAFRLPAQYADMQPVDATLAEPVLQVTQNGKHAWVLRNRPAAPALWFDEIRWPTDATPLVSVRLATGRWEVRTLVENTRLADTSFVEASRPSTGEVAVRLGAQWGILRQNGQWRIQPAAASYTPLTPGFLLSTQPVGAVGQISGGIICVRIGEKWGAIAISDGTVRINPEYDYLEPLLPNCLKAQRGEFWALLDSTGRALTEFRFEDIKLLNDRLACTLVRGQWQMVTAAGTPVGTGTFQRVNDFGYGLLQYQDAERTGLLRADGSIAVPAEYDEIGDLNGSLILLHRQGRYAIADTTGRRLSDRGYDEIQPFTFGVAPVMVADKWGLISPNGTEVLAPRLGTLEPIGPNLLRVAEAEGFRLYTFQGQSASRYLFEDLHYFVGNVAAVKLYGKWALLRPNGELVTSPEYDAIEPFQQVGGVVRVR